MGMGFLAGIGFFGAFVALLAVLGLVLEMDEDEDLQISPDTKHAVAVVPLEGEIFSPDQFRKQLASRVKNKEVKAIVVRIDSPGGGVGASEEIYRDIKLANEKKPVVCSLGGVAASGGFYAAMGCRKIVTNAGTLSGSIGVIVMLPGVRQIADRVGFEMNVIKSGKFKDSGSPFRPMDENDRGLFQTLVNNSYEQFVKVVSDARNIPIDQVKTVADGRVILGEELVRLKMADEIGGIERAASIALEETGDKNTPEILFPKRKHGLGAILDTDAAAVAWRLEEFFRPRILFRSFLELGL